MKHDAATAPGVSRETLSRLKIYEGLLCKWSSTINLVARGDLAKLWERHFSDCLQLASLVPRTAQSGVDLGSGAGFPGMVLAIATGVRFTLVEADRRKAAFLREVAVAIAAPVTIQAMRVEDVQIEKVDVLTARGLAPLSDLLDMGARFLKPRGVALFQKGATVETEIIHAQQAWNMTISRHVSETDASGVILKLCGLSHAEG